jgi:ABC-type lipoprotein export system ATPase subunit/GNAT superfamily N-acetyltransferase
MPRVELVRESKIRTTGRLLQLTSLFDVQPNAGHRVEWNLDIPIEEREWSIGLIVGPSGIGKSTIARELFGDRVVTGFPWPADSCILDAFPREMATDAAAGFLSSVGFGSVPEWLRPFHVLSTGQQFRATLARALAENEGLICVDEFTSVVDRQVAQICSAAVAKAVRRMERQFVAVTCHYDVEPWLDPDWVLDLGDAERPFDWRSVQCRPQIEVTLIRALPQAWDHFKAHHYLTSEHPFGAQCYVAFIGDDPVAWCSIARDYLRARTHPDGWRLVRTVVLPQYQGIGIGMAIREYIAGCFKSEGQRVMTATSHGGLIKAMTRSEKWECFRAKGVYGDAKHVKYTAGKGTIRPTASFRYIGPAIEGGLPQ